MLVSDSAALTSGVAGRYATALFELAKDGHELDAVERDMRALEAALAESADLRDMLGSPIHSRAEQGSAIAAIAARMGLGNAVTGTLGLMAQNRRLFVVPRMLASVRALIAQDRGEVTADVRAARPLTETQMAALSDSLKSSVGREVKLEVTVDKSLLGGLVVKVGSRMVDSSIRTRLANLQNAMKEVGQ